jgi:hypothetical protein
MPKPKHIICYVALSVLAVACQPDPDVVAVNKFATLASAGTDAFPTIASDFKGSCLRRAYHPSLDQGGETATIDPKTIDAGLTGLTTTGTSKVSFFDKWRSKQITRCEELFGKAEETLTKPNGVLRKYIKKLAELSSDDLTNNDAEFSRLESSLNAFGKSLKAFTGSDSGFTDKQIGGAVRIAKLIVSSAGRSFQREKVVMIIKDYDDDLALLIDGLSDLVSKDYLGVLDVEQSQLSTYYEAPILREINRLEREKKALLPKVQDKQTKENKEELQREPLPLTAVLVDEAWRVQREELDKRRQLAKDYVDILQQIKQAHNQLKLRLTGQLKSASKNADQSVGSIQLKESVAQMETLATEAVRITHQLGD